MSKPLVFETILERVRNLDEDLAYDLELYNMLVNKSIEKPIKPIAIPKNPDILDNTFYCPNCHFCFNPYNHDLKLVKYCSDCGQALDWGDFNETE